MNLTGKQNHIGQCIAGILVKLDSCSIRFLSAFVVFFYAFLLHEKVMFFLVSIFIRMSLSSLTRQFYWTKLFSKNVFYEGLNSPILKYRFHRLSYPNSKKKKSSQSDLRVLIGGGRNFVGDQFRIGGGNPQLI